jgi:hypothetical protein
VKAKPKKQVKKPKADEKTFYGGASGNKLIAGPIKQTGGSVGKEAVNK